MRPSRFKARQFRELIPQHIIGEIHGYLRQHYVAQWEGWQHGLLALDSPPRERDLYRASVAVLRSHESKDFLGGVIASLSIPWGFNKGDEDLGGYHYIYVRRPDQPAEEADTLLCRRIAFTK